MLRGDSTAILFTRFNSAVVLSWPAADPSNSGHMPPKDWAEQLSAFARNAQMTARAFLLDHHKLWRQPRLLSLPQVYDGIFQVLKKYLIINQSSSTSFNIIINSMIVYVSVLPPSSVCPM